MRTKVLVSVDIFHTLLQEVHCLKESSQASIRKVFMSIQCVECVELLKVISKQCLCCLVNTCDYIFHLRSYSRASVKHLWNLIKLRAIKIFLWLILKNR